MSVETSALPLADVAKLQSSHPMDSSRLLLSLLDLSREGERDHRQAESGTIVCPMVLRGLLRALQLRDEATLQHSRRVAMLCVGIANNLKWEPASVRMLEIAALLHDLGKIGVPDHILFKPGKLSPDESELISVLHNVGVDLLQACRLNHSIVEIISLTAEGYDPNNPPPRSESTSSLVHQGARILAVADAYDSMNNDQVFRKRMSHEQIMRVLNNQAGKRFDRNLVHALNRWIDEGGMALIADGDAETLPPIEALPDGLDESRKAYMLSNILSYLYLLESLYDGFYIVDSDLKIQIWNCGVSQLFDCTPADMLGRPWSRSSLHLYNAKGHPLPAQECPLMQSMSDHRPACAAMTFHSPQRDPITLEVQSLPLLDDSGNILGVAEILRDVSRAKRNPGQYRELRIAATQDPLTGIANRGELERRLDEMFAIHSRRPHNEPFSVIFLDIDHFKQINDHYLHATGDRVLIDMAKLVQDELYSGEFLARFGGEEFVIICPENSLDDAYRKAERLRRSIEQAGLGEQETLHVTASFGVAQLMAGDTRESLLDRADKALFDAKEQGRNRTCTRSPNQHIEEQAAAANQDPFICRESIVACLGSDLIVFKLGGFIEEAKARLIKVDEGELRLEIGSKGLFGSGWGKNDDKQPVSMLIEIGQEAVDDRRTKRVQVDLTIRPVGKPTEADFRARCLRLINCLRAHLVAD
jgi:diguanylate cyclase (GGDEF)-like protein